MSEPLSLEKVYPLLYNFCRWNELGELKQLLKQYGHYNIDVIRGEGVYLALAISNNQYEIFDTLLSYYEATQLKDDPDSLEYKYAKHKLHVAFDQVLEGVTIESEDIRRRMNPYLGSSVRSQKDDLSEVEDLISDSEDENNLNLTDQTDCTESSGEELNRININKLKLSPISTDQTVIEKWFESTKLVPSVW